MSEILLSTLIGIVSKASKAVASEYHKAISMCVRGKDLPGLWPKFYLYTDLTWTVGYEPTEGLIVLGSLDVKDRGSREMLDDLLIELGGRCTIKVDPIPPPEPPKVVVAKSKSQYKRLTAQTEDSHAIIVLEHEKEHHVLEGEYIEPPKDKHHTIPKGKHHDAKPKKAAKKKKAAVKKAVPVKRHKKPKVVW